MPARAARQPHPPRVKVKEGAPGVLRHAKCYSYAGYERIHSPGAQRSRPASVRAELASPRGELPDDGGRGSLLPSYIWSPAEHEEPNSPPP